MGEGGRGRQQRGRKGERDFHATPRR
jgi:hypothetical protein